MRATLLKIFKFYPFFFWPLLFLLLLSSCARYSQGSSYQLAAYYYQRGYYHRAFDILWIPVQHHEACAEYAMGYMYYYGIGTEKDQDIGRSLIKRAATKQYPPAILAMKQITQQRYSQYAPFEKYPLSPPRHIQYTPSVRYPPPPVRGYHQYRTFEEYPTSATTEGIWEIKQPLIGRNH